MGWYPTNRSCELFVPPTETSAIVADYSAAQVDALKVSLLAVAIFAVLGLWFTRRLPDHALGGENAPPAVAASGPDPAPAPTA